MKKFILTIFVLFLVLGIRETANAVCLQCPEIQKALKKEIKLTKVQKKEIKQIKKDMRNHLSDNKKSLEKTQKEIDKIIGADNPDIVKMMEIKKEKAQIKLDSYKIKNETYSQLFEVYTEEQKEIAKRILSENSGIKTKGKCDFCNDDKNDYKIKH